MKHLKTEVFPYELAFPLVSRGGLLGALNLGLAQHGKTMISLNLAE